MTKLNLQEGSFNSSPKTHESATTSSYETGVLRLLEASKTLFTLFAIEVGSITRVSD